ncbi:phage tail protein [Vibrio tritonius]|uniref:phage tail protein n=1 Tax=Vibrio tritonius TaxID=1435069 RepID=UPI00315DDA11
MSYHAGYKMKALRAHVERCLGRRIAQSMSVEMSNIELMLNPRNMGLGVDIAQQRYVAEFLIERLPFQKYDPAILFANVAAWLMDNDEDREEQLGELKDPEIEVVLEDEQTAEVLIQISFEEPIKLVKDAQGPIVWQGQCWSIMQYDVWVAENLREVVTAHAQD